MIKDDKPRRSQACYVADCVEGPYCGGEVLNTDGGYCNSGVAQGGIVNTPDGEWYGILFRDSGAVGRIPVLVPVEWKDDYPVFGVNGEIPEEITPYDSRPGYEYAPLYSDDDFLDEKMKMVWQWNHVPQKEFVRFGNGQFVIKTGVICSNVVQAPNSLTQRLMYPGSTVTVDLDASGLKDGDVAGLCLLQSDYGLVGITRDGDKLSIVQLARPDEADGKMNPVTDEAQPKELCRLSISKPEVSIRAKVEFTRMKDIAEFEVCVDGVWQKFGERMKLYFKLDHFCGVRAALFYYATKEIGGEAVFRRFRHKADID